MHYTYHGGDQVSYVYGMNNSTVASHPGVDALPVGDQTDDVEDGDGEVELNGGEQLHVMQHESAKLQEEAIFDTGVVGGPFVGVAPHQSEADGGRNFKDNGEQLNVVVWESFWL